MLHIKEYNVKLDHDLEKDTRILIRLTREVMTKHFVRIIETC